MAARRCTLLALAGILAGASIAAGAAVGASPASAQTGFERTVAYQVEVRIQDDGDLLVTERIDQDFASTERRGIIRKIPTRFPYEGPEETDGRSYERVTPIDDIQVQTSPAGTPDDVKVEQEGSFTSIRIGDPDTFITGRHQYRITYRLRGAINGFPDHDELYFNIVGTEWEQPIDQATATVTGPAAPTRIACFAGPYGSDLPCQQSSVDGTTARFGQSQLPAYQSFTVVVGLPKGALPEPEPILDALWTPGRAFTRDRTTIGAAGAFLAASIALVAGLLWKRGRDERYAGGQVAAAMGNPDGTTEAVPLLSRDEWTIEFVPPDNIRPGQLGVVIDERAQPVDVIATIIDLAVRGYLRIEEIEPDGLLKSFRSSDYRFVRLEPERDRRGGLVPYEKKLLSGLFGSDDEVKLSDLKGTWAPELTKVQESMYTDSVENGWFRRRPDKTRDFWRGIGFVVMLVGIGLTVLAAWRSRYGIVPLGVVLGGLVLIVFAGRMPARTAKGTAMAGRSKGFRELFEAGEGERQRFAERAGIFAEYLPYAIVFGLAERWARAFEGLDEQIAQSGMMGWYVGMHPFNAGAFSNDMTTFASQAAGSLSHTPAGSGGSGFSGGGFSGGGFGGGGGGSW